MQKRLYQYHLLTQQILREMKHMKRIAILKAHNNAFSGNGMSVNFKKLIGILLFWYTTAGLVQLNAQCTTLICNGTSQSTPLEVAIDGFCEVTIVPDAILEAEQSCTGTKILTVRDPRSNVIMEGTTSVNFDASAYVSETLSVTVTDSTTGIFCVGFVRIMDNLDPTIEFCNDTSISCIADTSVTAIGSPIIQDNCDNNVVVTYSDQLIRYGCDSTDAGIVLRRWQATDASGNSAICTQNIVLQRPGLANIEFPLDAILSCDNPNTDPEFTGRPLLEDQLLEAGGICNTSITFTDDTTSLCSNTEFQIEREWRVVENCSGTSTTAVQIILILDETGPTITCQDTIVAQTSSGQCYALVNLPTPIIEDNCDGAPDLIVNTSYGAVGLGPHPFVPVGIHSVQYIAIDECGNSTICTATLIVEDGEIPIAVCNQAAVALPASGLAMVNADVFNEGSTDNCAPEVYFKARREITGECNAANGDDSNQPGQQEWFDDVVFFCCEDLDEDPFILLRVYEINPGSGPVDPSREIPGGDLYGHFSDCRVSVDVQDRIGPAIFCPHDTIVDCSVDISDLSIFGMPQVFDNCGHSLTINESSALDDCGIGSITRTFVASDDSGNRNSCSQTIRVEVEEPYTKDDIQWPEDYLTHTCGAQVDPESLPAGFDKPIITGEKCGRLTVHYEDDVFHLSYPACYKVYRYWSIVDWCTYDPDNEENVGRFDYIQIIKVLDNEDPIMDCPEDVIVGINSTCDSAVVNIPPVTAVDCNPDILITNDSPFANLGGADASGVYPLGRTTVTFTASDRCGNQSTCSITINVIDNTAPTPVCIVGLSANIASMGSMNAAVVKASYFNGGSMDNCTAKEDLRFTIRRASNTPPSGPPETDELVFNCDDVGSHLIEFWVTDQSGNSDYCETFISIQDLNRVCPEVVSTGLVAGGIDTEMGENVEGVKVFIHNGETHEIMTNEYGLFALDEMPIGLDYTIVPRKEDDPRNGVSTLDLVLITQHILGVKPFDSPYKIIAGDVNKSGKVTTLDLIGLRKLILNITNELPNDNPSWRFVDAGYEFKDPQNPYNEFFPESFNINNFNGGTIDAKFVAIKIGDLNNSAVPNSLSSDTRNITDTWNLKIQDQYVKSNETILVDITAGELKSILGYQLTLQFNPSLLDLVALDMGDLPDMTEDNFGLKKVGEGLLTVSWNQQQLIEVPEETILFSVNFNTQSDLRLSEAIDITSRATASEAYEGLEDISGIALGFIPPLEETSVLVSDILQVYQNHPNPFSDRTTIPFQLGKSGKVDLKVFDGGGKLIYQLSDYYNAGYNRIRLNRSDFSVTGVLYYQLATIDKVITKKMVVTP